MTERRFYLNVLVVLAIIFAGISPACHFMSGKGSIEICAADGSIQIVEVDAGFDPFFIADNAPSEPTPAQELSETCPFCFVAGHQPYISVETASFDMLSNGGYLRVGGGTSAPISLASQAFQPRGPPTLS